MKTSEFIDAARDELHMGWVQRSYSDGQSVCVIGALDRVALRHLGNGGIIARAQAQQELEKTAAEMFPDIWSGNIPDLNDYYRTTKDDMLALLDKCSLKLDEVGR